MRSGNKRIVTSIRDDSKASAAKENLKRRMTYNPMKHASPNINSVGSSAGKSPIQSLNNAFYDDKNNSQSHPKF